MEIKILTEQQAWQEINFGGGLVWVLFPGDDFCQSDYKDWSGEELDDEQVEMIDKALRRLDDGQALQIL